LTFRYMLTEQDYKRCILERRLGRNLLLSLLITLAFLFTVRMSDSYYLISAQVYAGTALILFLVCAVLGTIVDRIAIRREYRSNSLLRVEHEYTIGEDGIGQASETGTSFIGWDKVFRIKRIRSFVLLYISRRLAIILPWRILERGEMEDLLKRKLPGGKHPRGAGGKGKV
jgi:hypothetical protein